METARRKLSLKEIFKLGYSLHKDSLGVLFPLSFCLYLFLEIISLLSGKSTSSAYSLVLIFLWLFAYTYYKAKQGGKLLTVKDLLFSSVIDKSVFMKFLTTFLLMTIFLILLFLLFIIPGVIFAVYWSFAVFVVLSRNLSGKQALDYSKRIVQGNWLTVFFLQVAGFTIQIVCLLPAEIIGALTNSFVGTIASSLTLGYVMPYLANVFLAGYLLLDTPLNDVPSPPAGSAGPTNTATITNPIPTTTSISTS